MVSVSDLVRIKYSCDWEYVIETVAKFSRRWDYLVNDCDGWEVDENGNDID